MKVVGESFLLAAVHFCYGNAKIRIFFVVVAGIRASRLLPEFHFPDKTRLYLAVKKKNKRGFPGGNKGFLGLNLGTP